MCIVLRCGRCAAIFSEIKYFSREGEKFIEKLESLLALRAINLPSITRKCNKSYKQLVYAIAVVLENRVTMELPKI